MRLPGQQQDIGKICNCPMVCPVLTIVPTCPLSPFSPGSPGMPCKDREWLEAQQQGYCNAISYVLLMRDGTVHLSAICWSREMDGTVQQRGVSSPHLQSSGSCGPLVASRSLVSLRPVHPLLAPQPRLPVHTLKHTQRSVLYTHTVHTNTHNKDRYVEQTYR